MADLPEVLGIGSLDNSAYADDTAIWASGTTAAEVKAKLEMRASLFSRFAAANGLVMNADKTQLLVCGVKDVDSFVVKVDNASIRPDKVFELLGVRFDTNLSTAPHLSAVATTARSRAALIARLALRIPRGIYLRTLAHGLFDGKVSYALAATSVPRLNECDPSSDASIRAIQIATNDVARSLTGAKRKDHIPVAALLRAARIESYNAKVIKATAIEAWKAFHSHDGPEGSRNPAGQACFATLSSSPTRTTRATSAGLVPLPRAGMNTFAVSACKVWNASEELRQAGSLFSARSAAAALVTKAPL